jgi:hypothetical protein
VRRWHGAVPFRSFDDDVWRPQVDATEASEAEFGLESEKLAWSCTCAQATKAPGPASGLAAALATWQDEAPADDDEE